MNLYLCGMILNLVFAGGNTCSGITLSMDSKRIISSRTPKFIPFGVKEVSFMHKHYSEADEMLFSSWNCEEIPWAKAECVAEYTCVFPIMHMIVH